MKLLLYMNMKNSKLLVLSMFGLASLFCQAEPYNCPQHGLQAEENYCPLCMHENAFSWCPNCRMHSIAMEGTPCPRCGQVK